MIILQRNERKIKHTKFLLHSNTYTDIAEFSYIQPKKKKTNFIQHQNIDF